MKDMDVKPITALEKIVLGEEGGNVIPEGKSIYLSIYLSLHPSWSTVFSFDLKLAYYPMPNKQKRVCYLIFVAMNDVLLNGKYFF